MRSCGHSLCDSERSENMKINKLFRAVRFRVFSRLSMGSLVSHKLRIRLLRLSGVDCAPDARIFYGVDISDPKVHIGSGVWINKGCKLYPGTANVILGDRVFVAADVILNTASHEVGGSNQRAAECYHRDIRIGDGTWIGCGAIVLAGVTVGRGCIIAAGSVVTKDCEPDCLYAGVPAKLKRRLEDGEGSAAWEAETCRE